MGSEVHTDLGTTGPDRGQCLPARQGPGRRHRQPWRPGCESHGAREVPGRRKTIGGWDPPEEEAQDALAEAAGKEAVADGAAEDAADAATGREEAEVERRSVGDDDTSAGREGGTPSRPGRKELITYRKRCEYQRDRSSCTDGKRAASSSW